MLETLIFLENIFNVLNILLAGYFGLKYEFVYFSEILYSFDKKFFFLTINHLQMFDKPL